MQEQAFKGSEFGLFEFQKSSVYSRAVDFYREADLVCLALRGPGNTILSDQLSRASQSLVLHISAASASCHWSKRLEHFKAAQAAINECVATLDLFFVAMVFNEQQIRPLHRALADLGKILSGAIRYWENSPERKPSPDYAG